MERRLEVALEGPADLQLVDALARLRLAAARAGARLTLRVDGDLAGLLALAGLLDLLDEP